MTLKLADLESQDEQMQAAQTILGLASRMVYGA